MSDLKLPEKLLKQLEQFIKGKVVQLYTTKTCMTEENFFRYKDSYRMTDEALVIKRKLGQIGNISLVERDMKLSDLFSELSPEEARLKERYELLQTKSELQNELDGLKHKLKSVNDLMEIIKGANN